MKKRLLLGFGLFAMIQIQAQENLVPNPSFEEIDGKIKGAGAIEMAYPWKSVTMNPVDLYSASAKSDEFSVPENGYGAEKANTGEAYAGVSFFGYMGRMPRTYLGTSLNKKLEAGKSYCMKFHVSLSDFSKYAVNNLAMYVAKEELTEKTDGKLAFTPQIKSLKNEPFEKQFLWTAICGVYEAEGGESFIAIGNFDEDDATEQEKIRLSREFMGNRQQNNAYYFIDDVSVVELNDKTKDDCLCDKIAGGKMEVEFKSFGTDASKKSEAKKTYLVNSDGTKADVKVGSDKEEGFSISSAAIYFAAMSYNPKEGTKEIIEEIVAYLEANPEAKLDLVGHIDKSEAGTSSLAKRRAYEVQKLLVEGGIDEARLTQVSMLSKSLADPSDPSKNRRVTFAVQ